MGFQDDLRKFDAAYVSPESKWADLLQWISEFIPEAFARDWQPREHPSWLGYTGPTVLSWQSAHGGYKDGQCFIRTDGTIWARRSQGELYGPCNSLDEAGINDPQGLKNDLASRLANPEWRY